MVENSFASFIYVSNFLQDLRLKVAEAACLGISQTLELIVLIPH